MFDFFFFFRISWCSHVLVALTPKVLSIHPAPQSTIMPNQLVTITFDMPVHMSSSTIYVGTSSCRMTSFDLIWILLTLFPILNSLIHPFIHSFIASIETAVEVTERTGVTVSFHMPAIEGEQVFMHVPSNVVVSDEDSHPNEEYRFTSSQYWTLVAGK